MRPRSLLHVPSLLSEGDYDKSAPPTGREVTSSLGFLRSHLSHSGRATEMRDASD
jgi:hypothetical protein